MNRGFQLGVKEAEDREDLMIFAASETYRLICKAETSKDCLEQKFMRNLVKGLYAKMPFFCTCTLMVMGENSRNHSTLIREKNYCFS